VLSQAGLLSKWNGKPSKKGTGFAQPLAAHEHWHIDVSYLNIGGTFYYLGSILDGFSRYIMNWDIRESMTEADIEIILQGAKEKYPEARPGIIPDNGPQFIAKDFKEFIRISGMTHVRTSPFYPQSNGKIERWHKSLKGECIRPGTPLSLEDARHLVKGYVDHYNNVRLNGATGYIMPKDMLAGRQQEIHAERDRKLEAARKMRKDRRQQAASGGETPGHWNPLTIWRVRPIEGRGSLNFPFADNRLDREPRQGGHSDNVFKPLPETPLAGQYNKNSSLKQFAAQ
jgi:hypothetical protein